MIRSMIPCVMAMATAASCGASAAGAQEGLTARLETTKASYVAGEPIELRLVVSNPTVEYLTMEVDYPFRGEISLSQARESVTGLPGKAPASTGEPSPAFAGGKVVDLPIAPGESWSTDVYAQRYMQAPPTGSYELEYSVKVDFSGSGTTQGATTSRGRVQVMVTPGTESELSSVLATIWSPFETAPEYGTRQTADTPLAIPYLAKLVEYGSSDSAVRALAKFRGNHDAEDILLDTLGGKRWENAAASLSVLRDWDYVLSADVFSRVLALNSQGLRLAALDYAEKINNLAYASAISDYTADSDTVVAGQAARVRDKLTEKGKWR